MTQKEKLHKAEMLAFKMKSTAERLKREARSYDCTWPLSYAQELTKAAEDFLKLK